MKKKIQDIIIGVQLGGYTSEQAAQQVLDLFAVTVSGLKPCPFCGGEAFVNVHPAACDVLCTVCLVKVTAIERETAISRWNTRLCL